MFNNVRTLRIVVLCLLVLCLSSSILCYRLGYTRNFQKAESARLAHDMEAVAAYNVTSNQLGAMLLPLEVCKRNPSVFTADERELLKGRAQFHIDIEERVLIPALRRGESFEPWPLDLDKEQRTVSRAKELLTALN